MKNIKRILLAFVAVFAAVLLVACGAKSDNGTYVYKPTKTEVKEILEEQGAPSSSVDALIDNVKLEVSVTIKDKTGSLKIKGEMMGQKTDQSFDMKVDQQKKTLQSKTGEGEKVKYKVSGDVFTFDLSGQKSSGHEAAIIGLFQLRKYWEKIRKPSVLPHIHGTSQGHFEYQLHSPDRRPSKVPRQWIKLQREPQHQQTERLVLIPQ